MASFKPTQLPSEREQTIEYEIFMILHQSLLFIAIAINDIILHYHWLYLITFSSRVFGLPACILLYVAISA